MTNSIEKKFTSPKLSTTGKSWYVWFRYLDEHTNKMKLIVRKGGVNYSDIPNKERISQLNALRKAILFKLENQGWNPLNNTYAFITPEQLQFEKLKNMGFNAALDFALARCEVASKTKLDYGTTVRFFKLAAEQLGINNTPIIEVKKQHIKLLLEQVKKERSWSNKAVNKNICYLGSVVDRLIEWEILETNPAHGIKRLPVTETQKFEPITEDEKKKITEYLYVNHYRFFVYLMVVYHTGIRPKEVLSLKIKNLSEDKSEITILPDLIAENSKTKKIRKVPINNHLQLFFRELKLDDYPNDYYIFGSPFTSGQGSKGTKETGSGALNVDYFKPSQTLIKRDTATKLWKKIVIDKLKIQKYQYAMKHTGADDKIMAGIDLDALRELYGHSSKFMTEKYARKVKELYKQQIVDLSPSF